MRLLVVGGCGLVGSIVVPRLVADHEIRVLDLRAPATPVAGVEYHQGDLHDVSLVESLALGVDSLVFMAMGPIAGWGEPENVRAHLDIAVPGLHATLTGAYRAGVRHMVYTSSMSVYPMDHVDPEPGGAQPVGDALGRYPDESVPPDNPEFYGLAKRLGETVCQAFTVLAEADAVCLRLCFPTPDSAWPRTGTPMQRAIATSARDTAAAIDAAIRYRGHGFSVFAISGDAAERTMSLARARRELGWWPKDATE
jgi:nucleoside-diphosphate-sugar epimerase